ncbi:hypothetical protein DSM3645_02653 [Blastopirellula marina DSM 3645]|uniref:Uncharacterized protein n=1 Tax=Blastopirellula marina DSM 3645 TaxID=314230 RepID=A3ZVJ4_9BACT|nr:hypothetical protein DSM3645_02653 [Blastopirellula marina DSM 3645]
MAPVRSYRSISSSSASNCSKAWSCLACNCFLNSLNLSTHASRCRANCERS